MNRTLLSMTEEGLNRCIEDATERRGTFVCNAGEFVLRYGDPTQEQALRLNPHVVLCKDGMIRPR